MGDADDVDINTNVTDSPGAKGSCLKFPTSKRLSDTGYSDDYLSLFHPYLLERRRVDTPFGIGICRRDAFRPSISSPEMPSVDNKKSMSESCTPVNGHQREPNTSKISISAGACGRGYVIRSGAGSTDPTKTKRAPELPTVDKQKKSISAFCTKVNLHQSRSNAGDMSISTGQCGRSYVVRSGAATAERPGCSSGLNKRPDCATSSSCIGIRKPGDDVHTSVTDTLVSGDSKTLEHHQKDSLEKSSLKDDQSIAEDVAIIRKQIAPQYITTIDVNKCQSRNASPESAMAYSPKVSGCKGTKDTRNIQSRSTCFSGCQKRAPVKDSFAKCTSYTSEPKLCYRSKCHFDNSVSCATPQFGKNKAFEAKADIGKEEIKIGSHVRILAHPDIAQLSFSVGRPSFITAVVIYVTLDGKYKLGTMKGVLGRLFARGELQPIDKGKLSPKDVPMRSITIREASTMSYTMRD